MTRILVLSALVGIGVLSIVVSGQAGVQGPSATIRNVDTVIPGHAPVSTWADFQEYADFSREFVSYAELAMKAGKTVDEAAAGYEVPPRFKGYTATAAANLSARDNLLLAYKELAGK
jgi:hypothetical protein